MNTVLNPLQILTGELVSGIPWEVEVKEEQETQGSSRGSDGERTEGGRKKRKRESTSSPRKMETDSDSEEQKRLETKQLMKQAKGSSLGLLSSSPPFYPLSYLFFSFSPFVALLLVLAILLHSSFEVRKARSQ
jgi:hypothetical protein